MNIRNDKRADYIENLIIKLGDAGDEDLIGLIDTYEEEIEELLKKLKEEK